MIISRPWWNIQALIQYKTNFKPSSIGRSAPIKSQPTIDPVELHTGNYFGSGYLKHWHTQSQTFNHTPTPTPKFFISSLAWSKRCDYQLGATHSCSLPFIPEDPPNPCAAPVTLCHPKLKVTRLITHPSCWLHTWTIRNRHLWTHQGPLAAVVHEQTFLHACTGKKYKCMFMFTAIVTCTFCFVPTELSSDVISNKRASWVTWILTAITLTFNKPSRMVRQTSTSMGCLECTDNLDKLAFLWNVVVWALTFFVSVEFPTLPSRNKIKLPT